MQGQQMPTWQFTPGQQKVGADSAITADQVDASLPAQESENTVSWTASEYIAHQKDALWYLAFSAGTLLFAALVYLVTRDVVPTGVIIICAVLLGIMGARKPRVLSYSIDGRGITIANKFYSYADFKSFGVIDEGGVSSIVFSPLKRFMPDLSVYIDKDDEERIAHAISDYLPFEERDHDLLERLMSRLRF